MGISVENLSLQMQNCAARRIHFHYRDRSMGISVENLSLLLQILPSISNSLDYRYRLQARNEVIMLQLLATTGSLRGLDPDRNP